MKTRLLSVVPALLLFAACNTTPGSSSEAAVNAKCPMSAEAVGADSPTVMFEGKKVAFCCDKCVAKWEKTTAEEKAAKLTAAMPAK